MVSGILVAILLVAGLIGFVVLIVGSLTRVGRSNDGIDAVSVRRFFQYVLLAVLYMVVAIGISDLVGRAFGAPVPEWQDGSQILARGLTFVGVGLPLAALLTWWTWRKQRSNPAEAKSVLYSLYLTITALVTLGFAVSGLVDVVRVAIGDTRLDVEALGVFLGWGLVWFGHWFAARHTLDESAGAPHVLLGSLMGLGIASAGIVTTLGTSLDLLFRPGLSLNPIYGIADGVSVLLAGALVWSLYWLGSAARLSRSPLWLAYVLPIGVGGGLILTLVAASRTLWTVLVWFFGDVGGRSASQHFDTTTMEFAAVLVGLLIWWYHRAVFGELGGKRTEVQRIYEYLVSGIALVAAASGVGTMLVALIEASTPGTDSGMTVMNTLLAAVTLLIVGVPVWWVFWRRIRLAEAADPATEVASITRKIYLVALFGVAGIAAVVALLVATYLLVTDIVAGHAGLATLRSIRYGLGVLAGTAAVSAYHGAVFRQDRALGIPAQPSVHGTGPRSVVLVGAADPDLGRYLSRATGARVELWGRLDEPSLPWDSETLLAALASYTDQDVLVTWVGDTAEIMVVDRSGRQDANPVVPDAPVPEASDESEA